MSAKENLTSTKTGADNLPGGVGHELLKPLPGEEELFTELGKYVQMALDLGADDALILPASEVPMDLRVWWKCQFPKCYGSGTNLHCPPRWKTPWNEARQLRDSYKYALVFRLFRSPDIWTGAGIRAPQYDSAYIKYMSKERGEQARKVLQDWLDWREEQRKTPPDKRIKGVGSIAPKIRDQARKDGHYFAITFGAGSCLAARCVDYGTVCIGLTTDLCRFPNKVCPEGSAALYTDFGALNAKMGWQTQVTGYCVQPEDVPDEPKYFGTGLILIE
ncbi:DUF2284 domain-containing protein [Chloroflexota bacterium]